MPPKPNFSDFLEDELTPQDRMWISRYMVHFNGARASREVGAGKNAKKHAYRMSQRPLVEEEIHRLLAVDNAQFMGARHALIRHYLAIVNVDPARLYRADGKLKAWHQIDQEDRQAIQSIARSEYKAPDGATSSTLNVKCKNSVQAGMALAKLMGWDKKADESDIGSDILKDAAESFAESLAGIISSGRVAEEVPDDE